MVSQLHSESENTYDFAGASRQNLQFLRIQKVIMLTIKHIAGEEILDIFFKKAMRIDFIRRLLKLH